MSQVKWRDGSRGSRLTIGWVTISVHHYIGCGDMWFLSGSMFDQKELSSEKFEDAKKEALGLVYDKNDQVRKSLAEISVGESGVTSHG